jgi:hypothetical protein
MKYIIAILLLTIHSSISQNETADGASGLLYYNSGSYSSDTPESVENEEPNGSVTTTTPRYYDTQAQNETVDYYSSGNYSSNTSETVENEEPNGSVTTPGYYDTQEASTIPILDIANDFNMVEQYLLTGNNTVSEVFTEQNIWIVLGVLGIVFICAVLVVYFFH